MMEWWLGKAIQASRQDLAKTGLIANEQKIPMGTRKKFTDFGFRATSYTRSKTQKTPVNYCIRDRLPGKAFG